MKTLKKIISWVSFVLILFAAGLASFGAGVVAANYSQDFFNFKGCWCLLNVIPLFAVSFSVEIFLILGLKQFGKNER
jgi:hypothetical protein